MITLNEFSTSQSYFVRKSFPKINWWPIFYAIETGCFICRAPNFEFKFVIPNIYNPPCFTPYKFSFLCTGLSALWSFAHKSERIMVTGKPLSTRIRVLLKLFTFSGTPASLRVSWYGDFLLLVFRILFIEFAVKPDATSSVGSFLST